MTTTYLEKVTAAKPETLPTAQLGALLAELESREARLTLKVNDLKAANLMVRTDFLRRMTEQGISSLRVEGAGLLTKSQTNRFSSEDWATTYEWLAQQQAAKIAAGENPGELFTWLGRSISAELCKKHLAETGNLPAGIKVTPQITLTFRPTKE